MKKVLIKAQNVEKVFSSDKIKNKIMDDLNFELYDGDFTVIMGPSGSGKSTLLYILSGLTSINGGKVYYNEENISGFSEKQMSKLRIKDFGFVFQQPFLISNLSLYENIIVAGYLNNDLKQKEVKEKTKELFNLVNLQDVKDRFPSEVSGGEMQRASIVRAIINNPKILFADEPTGALNKSNSEIVLDLLTKINKSGQSILMVTHDVTAASYGNRILYLEDGQIIGEKTLSKYNKKNAKKREEELYSWLSLRNW